MLSGHELTHAVTEFSSNLIYQAESGALNESFSDIFGNSVEFVKEGASGVGTGDWRIAEDIDLNPGNGLGFRSMANPNETNLPDTYEGTFWHPISDPGDNGGVHTNSGVQNFWFYLLATGGSGTNDNGDAYNVTGIGLVDAAKIAYHNNNSYLTPGSNYADARAGAIACAEAIFGVCSQQARSTAVAWYAVGVGGSVVDNTPPGCNITAIIPGPPKRVQVTVIDAQSGLQSIVVVTNNNCTVTIPAFAVGTTTPIVVVATKINPSQSSTVVLRVTDLACNSVTCDPVFTIISAGILPKEFSLGSNYPNPFNPTTTIQYALPRAASVTLDVYDMLGRRVAELVNGQIAAGYHDVEFNAASFSSGIYFYRMKADAEGGKSFSQIRKLMLMK